MRALDLAGQKFGRWLVVERAKNIGRASAWLCVCDCGTFRNVRSTQLNIGRSNSCGCIKVQLARENLLKYRSLGSAANVKHGMSGSPEHDIWVGIRKRCLSNSDPHFEYYGGRGIEMCERWRESFPNFFADMGPRPSLDHSVERINNDGNYEPGNCRWATKKEQANNRRPRRWYRRPKGEAA